jgi:predicted ATPase
LALLRPDLAPAPALDPAQEQRRIAQAFVQFFTHWASRAPLLVVVEDMHWSDDASLEALLALAYRSDDIHRSLATTLATLERERLSDEIRGSKEKHDSATRFLLRFLLR